MSTGAWHFDNPDPNKGLGLLDYEDSLFQPDDTRLQKHYFYGDGSNGRKDLQQVTHRLFKSDATDQNGVYSDFDDYQTQYFTDGFYARPKGMRYPGGVKLAYLYDFNGYLTHERDPVSGLVYRQTTVRNARHQTEGASLANGAMTQVSDYHGATGQMATHAVTSGLPLGVLRALEVMRCSGS
jgi:hypothetical protein